MSSDYRPIACSVYDVLEVAAMHRQRLILKLGERSQEIIVHDVYARGQEEFLDGIDPSTQSPIHIRLDAITEIIDPAANKSYLPLQC
jgi:transcriptional antiterminator Rof (Rho-off)